MTHVPAGKARALLDAHVAYVIAQLEGPALHATIERNLDAILADARRLKLKAVVGAGLVKQTVREYAVHMRLGGAMPELVGDIARKLYRHKALDRTTLAEALPDRMFEQFLDKALELKTLREALVRESVANPIYSSLIAELLYSGIRDYVGRSRVADRIPGARAALRLGKNLVDRAKPELGAMLEENLKSYVRKNTQASMQASEAFLLRVFETDEFREVVLGLWADNKHRTLADLRDFAGSLDIEEFFVISYEYWQHLRGTHVFQEMVDAGIDAFYAKYGNSTLHAILDEVGVTREMMLADALRFAPPLVAALKKQKLLEPLIRRNLEGFYASEAAQAILRA
ncbi:MAG: hypothetical protein HYV18_02845 [Gammaproteobacteria bacterium]|nr:hypothetical protein [Gammaproteobacteria bacterium]